MNNRKVKTHMLARDDLGYPWRAPWIGPPESSLCAVAAGLLASKSTACAIGVLSPISRDSAAFARAAERRLVEADHGRIQAPTPLVIVPSKPLDTPELPSIAGLSAK